MKNTRLWYKYMNKLNQKAIDYIVVAGSLTEDTIESIKRTLAKGHQFIPAQVGMKSLAGSTEDDHVWHTLDLSEAQPTMERPALGLDGAPLAIQDIVEAFEHTVWDPVSETARMFDIPQQEVSKVHRLTM